jgi:hypothetical protein
MLASVPVSAGGSAPLAVTLTVVRSCAVGATSLDGHSAAIDLRCSQGAASALRSSAGPRQNVSTLRLVVPSRPFSSAAVHQDLQVATINF